MMNMSMDAAPIVEVYHPDSKPNAPIEMERQAPLATRNYNSGAPRKNISQSYELPQPQKAPNRNVRESNDDENIFALAAKKVDNNEFEIPTNN